MTAVTQFDVSVKHVALNSNWKGKETESDSDDCYRLPDCRDKKEAEDNPSEESSLQD